MKTNNNKNLILFENTCSLKPKIILKNFFLSNYFSKRTLNTQKSYFLPTFFKVKPKVLTKKNLYFCHLKKNTQFLKHSKKNCFFLSFPNCNEQRMPEIFLNFYLKRLNSRFHKNKQNMLKKIKFNNADRQIQKKISQKEYYECLKQNHTSLYQLLFLHKINFLKKNFLWLFSIVFLNKQIHRFLYFYIFSKRTEIYYFSYFFRFFLTFSLLNIFLFNFLYDSAKKQHLNNSNAWIFQKYWLFLQSFPYFFYNYVNPVHTNIYLKQKLTQSIKNRYYFMSDDILFSLKKNKNLIFLPSKNFPKIFLNLFVQSSVTSKTSLKKDLTLKTYYLDTYKTNYIFKRNAKKKEKNYPYFISIRSKISKLITLKYK